VSEFKIGQRWVSHTETDLGLGIIVDIEGRQLRISFPAVGEERIYAMHSAPLTRIEHKPGETIHTQDKQSLQVVEVKLHHGRLLYHAKDKEGQEHKIDEIDLNCFVELTTPKQRITSGQLDNNKGLQAPL